jgi:hypothetical protein
VHLSWFLNFFPQERKVRLLGYSLNVNTKLKNERV